jgi:quercetin dioxygenase-like cupin family protein
MDSISLTDRDAIEAVSGVYLTQLAAGDRMSVQHYDFDTGAAVPGHDHDHEQVGFVYHGVLTLLVNGEERVYGPGDSYAIPSGVDHAAENRGNESVRGIDVFSPPRTDPDWGK